MERRQFIAASVAASALAVAGNVEAQSAPAPAGREYYQMRRYGLQSGPQTKLTESYFGDALIPALARMGMGPVGAFRVEIGPETPVNYLLIPGASVQGLVELAAVRTPVGAKHHQHVIAIRARRGQCALHLGTRIGVLVIRQPGCRCIQYQGASCQGGGQQKTDNASHLSFLRQL